MLLLSHFFSLMTLEVLDDSSSSPPTGDEFYFIEVSATHPTCPVPVQTLLIFLGV